MIYWAPFLHFYQPPIQSHAVLKKICNESYRPLVKLFHTHPSAKVTINISGVLTELLMDHGGEDIVKGLKALAQNGQVEFVGSAKYHAILPLVPEDEIKRQIELNEKAGILFYRNTYRPSGFFPPEMCYSRKILQPIADAGYGWLLISGVACSKSWPMDKIYRVKAGGSNLCVLFRDDILSNKISFHNIDSKGFLQHLSAFYRNHNINKKEGSRKDIYVITAMDAETFGHHIKNWDKTFLQEVYEAIAVMDNTRRQLKEKRGSLKRQRQLSEEPKGLEEIKAVTLNELMGIFPKAEFIEPHPSSWSTSAQDIENKNPFPLWNNPDNHIHKYLWEHIGLCLELVNRANDASSLSPQSKQFAVMARSLLDRAFFSCHWWWATKRPMWDINIVNKGLILQEEAIFNAYKAINLGNLSESDKKISYYKVIGAIDASHKIRDLLFTS